MLRKSPKTQGPLSVGCRAEGHLALSKGRTVTHLTDLYLFHMYPFGFTLDREFFKEKDYITDVFCVGHRPQPHARFIPDAQWVTADPGTG